MSLFLIGHRKEDENRTKQVSVKITDTQHQFTHGNTLVLIRPSKTPLHEGPINQGNPPNKQNTKICCGFFQTAFYSSHRRQYPERSGSNFANNCREHHQLSNRGRPDQLSMTVAYTGISRLKGNKHACALYIVFHELTHCHHYSMGVVTS
jgi:hypothetical protein